MIVTKFSSAASGGGRHFRRRECAFSLVEVVLALGVVVFCLLILIALIPLGLNANRLSREQIIAFDFCGNIESDLRATNATNSTSPLYQISIPGAGASLTNTLYDTYAGTAATNMFGTAPVTTSQYRFTITLTGPTTSHPNDPVLANILASWPPQINPLTAQPIGKVNLSVAINRVGQ